MKSRNNALVLLFLLTKLAVLFPNLPLKFLNLPLKGLPFLLILLPILRTLSFLLFQDLLFELLNRVLQETKAFREGKVVVLYFKHGFLFQEELVKVTDFLLLLCNAHSKLDHIQMNFDDLLCNVVPELLLLLQEALLNLLLHGEADLKTLLLLLELGLGFFVKGLHL